MVASKDPLVMGGGGGGGSGGSGRRSLLTRGRSKNKIDPDKDQQDGDNNDDYESLYYGGKNCKPYKQELIARQMENNAPGVARRKAVIGALRDLGVEVFIIEGKSIASTTEILYHVKRVVGFVASKNRSSSSSSSTTTTQTQARGPMGYQRCLLYLDQEGRLFNLLLVNHAIGPAARYQDYLETFSGLQAMVAIVVMCRSLPCAMSDEQLEQLQPAYLSLILGLIFTEELSLSWLNAGMMVRAAPSVSAHTLTSMSGSDSLRKIILFTLAMAGAASGRTQKALTLFGISAAVMVLLSNLGSRAWHSMRWQPLSYQGWGADFVAWILSIATGMCIPYMGHRTIEVGGKAALEHVLESALVIAAIFIISDLDEIQKFLVLGSEVCNQDYVNMAVGAWWGLTLLCSLFLVQKIPYMDHHPDFDGEPVLLEDHASPVGYKVPSIPDFEIDPSLAKRGFPLIPYWVELVLGVSLAIGLGIGIMSLAFTDMDEQILHAMQNTTMRFF